MTEPREYEPLSEAELAGIEARLSAVAPKEPYRREIFRFLTTIRAQQEEIGRLRSLERRYARHRDGCQFMKKCTCGFAAARKAALAKEEG